MKITCLINNYNYANYVSDAIDSAMSQTVPFDEIVIVDDGSTDNSREVILNKTAGDETVKAYFKDNGGQMSALNYGFEKSAGDIVCFLDSDDILKPDYLEKTLAFFEKNESCDYLFCAIETFGQLCRIKLRYPSDRDLGITLVRVNHIKSLYGIGGSTSTLAIRRSILEKVLPYPHFMDWKLRADDVLGLGASMVGAHKYFNSSPLVRYRIHSNNGYAGRKNSIVGELRRQLAINRLIIYYRTELGYEANLSYLADKEFATNPTPDFKLLKSYSRIIRDGIKSYPSRLIFYCNLISHYISSKFR